LELQAQLRSKFPYLLEIAGMSIQEQGSDSVLSMDHLRQMDETDIMLQFFGEHFSYVPNERQLKIFQEALSISEEDVQ
jgi:hypothetical protein